MRSQSVKLSPLKITILPALWSYVGVVEVEVEKVILGGRFLSYTWERFATRAYNLLELQGYKVIVELS